MKAEASSTAVLIACSQAYLAGLDQYRTLVTPEAYQIAKWLMSNYSWKTRLLARVFHTGWFPVLVWLMESVTVPGILEHYVQRKRAIETLARQAIAEGCGELCVLGAGFDALAIRMARDFPELRTVEADQVQTQAWKQAAPRPRAALPTENLHFSAIDLTQEDGLRCLPAGEQRKIWVAEGLMMYLHESAVRRVLNHLHTLSPRGSRIIFTFLEPDHSGRADFRRRSVPLNLWLSLAREPFNWGILRDDLPAFMAQLGFRLLEVPQHQLSEIHRLNVGEHIALAEVC